MARNTYTGPVETGSVAIIDPRDGPSRSVAREAQTTMTIAHAILTRMNESIWKRPGVNAKPASYGFESRSTSTLPATETAMPATISGCQGRFSNTVEIVSATTGTITPT